LVGWSATKTVTGSAASAARRGSFSCLRSRLAEGSGRQPPRNCLVRDWGSAASRGRQERGRCGRSDPAEAGEKWPVRGPEAPASGTAAARIMRKLLWLGRLLPVPPRVTRIELAWPAWKVAGVASRGGAWNHPDTLVPDPGCPALAVRNGPVMAGMRCIDEPRRDSSVGIPKAGRPRQRTGFSKPSRPSSAHGNCASQGLSHSIGGPVAAEGLAVQWRLRDSGSQAALDREGQTAARLPVRLRLAQGRQASSASPTQRARRLFIHPIHRGAVGPPIKLSSWVPFDLT
jgi:hypothetical protein